MGKILPGAPYANRIVRLCKEKIAALGNRGAPPGLAFVLVGDDQASKIYVARKQKAAAQIGIRSHLVSLPEAISTDGLIARIEQINNNPAIHGLIAQQPLPPAIDTFAVVCAIAPGKDVDGLHPHNLGLLAARSKAGLYACTARGCVFLLREAGVQIAGATATVIGRSLIVGRPLALMLTDAGATVTVCHTRTRNLAAACRSADILIVAAGCPGLVSADMVKPGATVLDVGINRGADGALCGDVDAKQVGEIAGYLTPVPGGIGPLTVAMLMRNTLQAAGHPIGV